MTPIPFGDTTTIPRASVYQQIHDYVEMANVAGGKPVPITIKGLGFRPVGKSVLTGRNMEIRVALGHGPNSAAKASATFSKNLPNPTWVVGSSNAYTRFSFKTFTGTGDPNPIGIPVPFPRAYIYLPRVGSHFCWEWQHRNASTGNPMTIDAIGSFHRGTVLPNFGQGCNAWSDAQVAWRNAEYVFENSLSGAPAKTAVLGMVALQKQQIKLAGWCSNLEILPLIQFLTVADAAGQSRLRIPLGKIRNLPSFDIYFQYAFADKRRPFGIGLSNASAYRTPLTGGWNIARIFNMTSTRSSGSAQPFFGLVVGFLQ